MLNRLAQLYEALGTRDLVQILILTVLLFVFLRFLGKISGTGSSLSRGLGLVVVGLFLMLQVVIASLDLTELATVLDYLLTAVLVALLVIFQPELRRGLVMLGRAKVWQGWKPTHHALADPLANAAVALASECIGALVAVQRGINLTSYAETGERIDAQCSANLVRHGVHAAQSIARRRDHHPERPSRRGRVSAAVAQRSHAAIPRHAPSSGPQPERGDGCRRFGRQRRDGPNILGPGRQV